jgi:hypothetical protein
MSKEIKVEEPQSIIGGSTDNEPDPAIDREAPSSDIKPLDSSSPAEPTQVSLPIIETDFAELEDGSLVEMIEDPEKPSRTLLAIFKMGEVRYVHKHKCAGQVLVPIPREREIVRHVRLPRGAKPYESVAFLLREIDAIFSCCLDLEEKYRFLLASFVLSTWFIELLPVAPYVALVGLPCSGKSTVLRLLSLLCRRSLLTADITSAALYRVCDRLTPTLLIDETGTAGKSKDLFHLLRTGTSRDVIALRRGQSFRAFGAKVVSWTELPNDAALNSRCIVVPVHETKRTDLKRLTDRGILEGAADLQKQFLQYRFEKYRVLSLPRIPGDERLHSRARDLYETLALPMGENREACQRLVECFTLQQYFNREPLYPTHAAVLHFLYFNIHSYPWTSSLRSSPITIGQLTDGVNVFLKFEGERFRLSPKQVGAALTALGMLNRRRTSLGWKILIDRQDEKRIHDLIEFYGKDRYQQQFPMESFRDCELCTDLENPAIWTAKRYQHRAGPSAGEKTGQPEK